MINVNCVVEGGGWRVECWLLWVVRSEVEVWGNKVRSEMVIVLIPTPKVRMHRCCEFVRFIYQTPITLLDATSDFLTFNPSPMVCLAVLMLSLTLALYLSIFQPVPQCTSNLLGAEYCQHERLRWSVVGTFTVEAFTYLLLYCLLTNLMLLIYNGMWFPRLSIEQQQSPQTNFLNNIHFYQFFICIVLPIILLACF